MIRKQSFSFIEKQVRKSEGDGVINLTIHEQYDFVDFVIFIFGSGIVNTRTVKVNGDIFKKIHKHLDLAWDSCPFLIFQLGIPFCQLALSDFLKM